MSNCHPARTLTREYYSLPLRCWPTRLARPGTVTLCCCCGVAQKLLTYDHCNGHWLLTSQSMSGQVYGVPFYIYSYFHSISTALNDLTCWETTHSVSIRGLTLYPLCILYGTCRLLSSARAVKRESRIKKQQTIDRSQWRTVDRNACAGFCDFDL